MTHPWKIALLLAVILLLTLSVALAWSAPQKTEASKFPAFSAKDRELIETYYTRLIGTLAPGSIDRSTFSLGVERSLVPGSHVPMQLQKELAPLPGKLESQLSMTNGDYLRYRLGHHVVLVKKGDMTIADILKNIAPK
jgi:hypothetical protein